MIGSRYDEAANQLDEFVFCAIGDRREMARDTAPCAGRSDVFSFLPGVELERLITDFVVIAVGTTHRKRREFEGLGARCGSGAGVAEGDLDDVFLSEVEICR